MYVYTTYIIRMYDDKCEKNIGENKDREKDLFFNCFSLLCNFVSACVFIDLNVYDA